MIDAENFERIKRRIVRLAKEGKLKPNPRTPPESQASPIPTREA